MAQEVGVRNVQELKQFGSDLKRLSEQLSAAFMQQKRKGIESVRVGMIPRIRNL